MSSVELLKISSGSPEDTVAFGERLGRCLRGGDVVELVSDVGGGKTTLVRGMAFGVGSSDQVQSPTFTIQRIYKGEGRDLHHFDFYRIQDPGVLRELAAESIMDKNAVVVIEWGGAVSDALPQERLRLEIVVVNESRRELELTATGERYRGIVRELA